MGGKKSIKNQLFFVYSQLRTFIYLDFSDFFCLLRLPELGWGGGGEEDFIGSLTS